MKSVCAFLLFVSLSLVSSAMAQTGPPAVPEQAPTQDISPGTQDVPATDEPLPDDAIIVDEEPMAVAAPAAVFASQNRDIGAVAAAGSASSANGTFTINASGEDIWGTADEFHFVYIQLTGDMQIVARVTGVEFTDGWAKAGLMARETLDANSRNFMVFVTPQLLSGIQWRDTTGGGSTYVPGNEANLPHWLKLVRIGNTLAGYRSVDEINWIGIGSTAIALPSTLYVGMAVTSHKDGTLCTATFDNVTQSSSGGGGGGGAATPAAPSNLTASALSSTSIKLIWTDNATNENVFTLERSSDGVNFEAIAVMSANSTTYTDTGLSPNTRYWYYVFASNAAGNSPASNVAQTTTSGTGSSDWHHEDVGAVGATGNFSQSGNTYTVNGSGFDIWNEHDEFHYAYQRGTNNVQIVARITGMANTSPWAKAGVMIRESQIACYGFDDCQIYEEDFAKNVMLALTPNNGLAFQWRPTAASTPFYIDAGPASAPVWVKLVKSGGTFTGYRSPDGVNWTQVGTVTVNMGATSSLSLGLAVTSHNDGTLNTATFDNVTIDNGRDSGGGTGIPAAPTELIAAATSSNRISLTWRDNSTIETGFILERSTDGTSFIQIGAFPANNETAVEAVAPGSHHWYRVAATNSFGISPWSNVAEATTSTTGGDGSLPPPWQDATMGTANWGSARFTNGVFYVIGNGLDIYGGNDAFHWAFQPANGDVTIVAAVEGPDPVTGSVDPWARIGLMIRESYASSGAENVMVFLSHEHGTGMTFRQGGSSGGNGSTQYIPGPASARFLKLTRAGSTFSAYSSPDGNSWQLIGSATVSMPVTAYVGLAVTSHSGSNKVLGQFSQVSVTGGGGGGGGGGAPGWRDQDIGNVSAAGSSSQSGGTLTVGGSGSDIWGNADEFHYTYQNSTNDAQIVARITGMGNTSPWAKAGVMMRASLAAGAQHVILALTPGNGLAFQWRSATDGPSSYLNAGAASAPVWVKLVKSGNTFTGYRSADGVNWTPVGSVNITMPGATFLTGLAVTSDNDGTVCLANFDNVTITGGGGGGGGGSNLPSPWQNKDIGPVTLSGSASFDQGTFTIKGDGADIWGSNDAFHYVYLVMQGNGDLVARVTALQNTEPWAKAGVMVRQTLTADSPNVFAMATADHGTGLQWREAAGGGSGYIPGPFWSAPVWLRVQRQGNIITSSTSLNGTTWTVLGTQTMPSFTGPVAIGLAVTSHNNAALNTSTFDNVTWTPQ